LFRFDSLIDESVVLMIAELINEETAVPGRIAATIWMLLWLVLAARLPRLKLMLSGFDGLLSTADAGTLTKALLSEALITRNPSGRLSLKTTSFASIGLLLIALSV